MRGELALRNVRIFSAGLLVVLAQPAHSEPLPSGAIGGAIGGVSGTGPDAKRIGFGYQVGIQASWQPTSTERKIGWTLRGALLFGQLYTGSAPQIDPTIRTVQMDLTIGARFRPWATPSRFLTLRGGAELLRTNEPIPPLNSRAFLGGIASVGFDQYAFGFLFSIDVRYGLIATSGPSELGLLLSIGRAGP
ncbi:MAG: hypothetical protein JWO36_1484 [Myxococcales bacterium]|nr:hypothetical protein [Myxococcales bacterium]